MIPGKLQGEVICGCAVMRSAFPPSPQALPCSLLPPQARKYDGDIVSGNFPFAASHDFSKLFLVEAVTASIRIASQEGPPLLAAPPGKGDSLFSGIGGSRPGGAAHALLPAPALARPVLYPQPPPTTCCMCTVCTCSACPVLAQMRTNRL